MENKKRRAGIQVEVQCKQKTIQQKKIKMSSLIWNIRSVNDQKEFTRLITMHKRHQFCFIGLMEPFYESLNSDDYKRKLGMQYATANISCKICAFMDFAVDYSII